MADQKYAGLLISSFNADNFAGLLSNDGEDPVVTTNVAPFGQVYQSLMDREAGFWKTQPDFVIVWSRPEDVISSFKGLMEYQRKPIDAVLDDVDAYADQIAAIADRVRAIFIPTWVVPASYRGYGLLDMRDGLGLNNVLMRMNLRLAEKFRSITNIYLLNSSKWVEMVGRNAFNPKLWYMGKIGFSNDVFREAVRDVKAGIRSIFGQAKKMIILDLDDTLWGGIVGDDGWENIVLGGHNPTGEAFVDFQKELKALTNRGIILGVVSKNDEAVALEAITKHPEMVLKLDDFAGWRINWNDKAQNILNLVAEVNLGLQSVVFIDDNPVERARVQDMLPEVLVPEWPEDKMLYKKTLQALTCFDSPQLSLEDAERAKMYVDERKRKELQTSVGSLDEWLESLQMMVRVEELNEINLPRAVQLFNKTNQMNLTTRRMTETELVNWAGKPEIRLWTFRVADKFGDSGLTGIMSIEEQENRLKIIDWLLSCRVMGRKVEETMLAVAVRYAQDHNLEEVVAEYLPTKKNHPCLEFWQRSGFEEDNDGRWFCWKTNHPYPFPAQVSVQYTEEIITP